MAVRAHVGLGDGEDHLLAGTEPRQPLGALGIGAEARDELAADRSRHEDEQERAASCRELLGDDRELADAAATAAVRLGQVDPEEPVVADRVPERVGLLSAAGPIDEVLVAEARADVAHRGAQQAVLGGLVEVHRSLVVRWAVGPAFAVRRM